MFKTCKEMTLRFLLFLKRIAVNRIGQCFFVVHLILVVYTLAEKPLVSRAVNNAFDKSEVVSASLYAGRLFHWYYESSLMKTLFIVDLPGAFLGLVLFGAPIGLVLSFLPPLGEYDESWLFFALCFAGSSIQWMLIGYRLDRRIRLAKKSR